MSNTFWFGFLQLALKLFFTDQNVVAPTPTPTSVSMRVFEQ